MNRRYLRPILLGVAARWPPRCSRLRRAVQGQARPRGVVAIRNATLVTVSHGTIQNGTIVHARRQDRRARARTCRFRPAPRSSTGTGKFVSPGIIDAHSHIANDAINEGATAVSSMTGMGDVLNPLDIAIQRDLAGGVTTANILHGSANPIGGKTVVIKLRWGVRSSRSNCSSRARCPASSSRSARTRSGRQSESTTGPRRYPTTRQGVEFVIRDAFTRAHAYQKQWQDYQKAKAANQDVMAPRRDLQMDALVEILEGKRLVHVHCYRADEILMMIRLAEEMGFKVATFQHVLEGYKVAKEIAAHGAGGSTFSDWWGYKIEAEDAIPGNASVMTAKGVTVSINSDSAEHARRLNTEAAKSVRWGDMNDDQAIAMVTLNPAKQLRIDQRVGSLDVGKDADVVHLVTRIRSARTRSSTRRSSTASPTTTACRNWRALDHGREGKGGDERRPRAPARRGARRRAGAPGNLFNIESQPLDVKLNANGAAWAITNARIVPVTGPVIEQGHDRHSRQQDPGDWRERVAAGGRARSIDARGASRLSRASSTRPPTSASTSLACANYDDVSEMLDFNQMLRTRVAYQSDSDAIPVARVEGITSAGIFMGGGVITGDVPLMNLDGWTWEENMVRPVAGLALTFPGGGGGGRGGGGGGGGRGGGAGGGAEQIAGARHAADAGARVRRERQPADGLEPRAARARSCTRSSRSSCRPAAKRRSATPSRGPNGRA